MIRSVVWDTACLVLSVLWAMPLCKLFSRPSEGLKPAARSSARKRLIFNFHPRRKWYAVLFIARGVHGAWVSHSGLLQIETTQTELCVAMKRLLPLASLHPGTQKQHTVYTNCYICISGTSNATASAELLSESRKLLSKTSPSIITHSSLPGPTSPLTDQR